GTMFGMFFFLTQFLQGVLGFSPIATGIAFLPLTLGIIAFTQLVPRLLPRLGTRTPLIVGAALITGGMVWLTRLSPTSTYVADLLGPLLLFGVGAGTSFVALTMASLAGVRAQAVRPDGKLEDDFFIRQADRMVHVLNAPSPAATASISIGRAVADLALKELGRPPLAEAAAPAVFRVGAGA
ncbi:MFS transporter, partial [bacterium]|nr:MFS transporter [bacterium]